MSDFFKESDFYATTTKVGFDHDSNCPRYACEIANRLLQERGTVVYGVIYNDANYECFSSLNVPSDTHTALLINIEPLIKDSAEKILADLIETAESLGSANPLLSVGYYIDRAKALKGKL